MTLNCRIVHRLLDPDVSELIRLGVNQSLITEDDVDFLSVHVDQPWWHWSHESSPTLFQLGQSSYWFTVTLSVLWRTVHRTPLGLCWSRMPGLLPVSAASPSTDHEHGTVCQSILDHQIRPSASSSVISRPTCLSSSLRCCWQVGSAPFVRRRCDCLASSAPFINIQTYLLTFVIIHVE